jgi:glucose-6-phosphate 1-dehydrogenase
MPLSFVIFGASGDLTSRKLIPALYRLFLRRKLPKDSRIIGIARSPFTSESWREELSKSAKEFIKRNLEPESWNKFLEIVHYQPGDVSEPADFEKLGNFLNQLEGNQPSSRIYYLSIMPQLYAQAAEQLGRAGLADETLGERRLVIEKPFGTNLTSARELNESIHRVFDEDQIYRIDHYLGKETVQNILVFRFGNSIFEPLWNRNYIDHVQITVAEEVRVGRRAAYYDKTGILRDMFQNHLLQLLMITAMEAPAKFSATLVRDEKVKVLQAIRDLTADELQKCGLRGQYRGYREEEDVPDDSPAETFAALKLFVDNWRWKGVPFYLRSGKAMSCRTTQIVIQFHEPPHFLFEGKDSFTPEANRLVIQIQPAEGIQLHFQSKVPNEEMRMRLSELDFRFDHSTGEIPDAYERLLLDAINGDASLFARSDEVETAWTIIDPFIEAWRSPNATNLFTYEPGLWGPTESNEWMQADNRQWFDVCPIIK